jgi:hypothetical protein
VAAFAAQRTLSHDPGIRHRFDWSGDGLSASFASDGVVADSAFREVEHLNSMGEYKAKVTLSVKLT